MFLQNTQHDVFMYFTKLTTFLFQRAVAMLVDNIEKVSVRIFYKVIPHFLHTVHYTLRRNGPSKINYNIALKSILELVKLQGVIVKCCKI